MWRVWGEAHLGTIHWLSSIFILKLDVSFMSFILFMCFTSATALRSFYRVSHPHCPRRVCLGFEGFGSYVSKFMFSLLNWNRELSDRIDYAIGSFSKLLPVLSPGDCIGNGSCRQVASGPHPHFLLFLFFFFFQMRIMKTTYWGGKEALTMAAESLLLY